MKGIGLFCVTILLNGSFQFSPLNMALVCIESVNWEIHLFLESLPSLESSYSFDTFKEYLSYHCIVGGIFFLIKSNVSNSSFCAKFICSREVIQESCLSYCVSFVPTLFCYITSNSVLCFVSLMRETSWPSFDESLPVDTNTSSRKKI